MSGKRIVPLFIFTFFFCCFSVVKGQDWKTIYDRAVSQYQSQQYAEALVNAEKAYTLSKTLEPRNQAYTAQLITAICIDNNQPDEGLKFIEDEITLYQKTEGEKSKTYTEALRKQITLLQLKGSLKEAEAKCELTLAAIKNSEGESSLSFSTLLSQYGQLAAANGNFEKAKATLDQSLGKLALFPEAGEDYMNTLALSAAVDKKLSHLPSAEKKYKQLISIYEQNNLQSAPEYNEAKTALAEIQLTKNEKTDPSQVLQDASLSADVKVQHLLKTAIDLQTNGKLEKAAGQYKEATDLVISSKLENNSSFSVLMNYSRVLLELKNINEAGRIVSLTEQQVKKLYAPGSTEDAFLQFTLGDLAMAQDKLSVSIDAYQKAASSNNLFSSAVLLRSLINASKKLLNANQSNAAIQILKPALSDQKNISVLPEKDKIQINLTYCQALTQSGQADQAIVQLNQAITSAISAEAKNSYQLELAEALKTKGEWTRALQLLTSANAYPLDDELKAQNFYQIAKLNQQLGHFSEAEKEYRTSLEYYRKLQQAKPEQIMQVYNSLAILFTQLGNYEQAEQLYLDLLKQTDTFSGFYVTLQQNLAAVYEETLRYDEATQLLEKVLEQDKQRLGEHHPDYAIALQNLAAVYQKTGRLEKAKELYTKALQIDRENFGEQNLSYATKAANLAVVYEELDELPQAKALLESALKVRESKLGKDHPDYAFNEYNLAVLLQRTGETQRAIALFKHVSAFYIREVNELFPAMSEKEKTAFYNKINEVIMAYQDFAIETGLTHKELLGDLFNFRLTTKALLLNSSNKVRNRILASGDPALLQRFAEWLHTKEELGKLYTLNIEERNLNKSKIEALQLKVNESEKWLSSQSELFASATENETADWRKVKAKLKPDEAAIEIIRLQLNIKNDSVIYAAMILKPELAEPAMVILPHGRQMETREFSFYRNNIRFRTLNERSYGVYWKPLQPYLNGTKTIYFSPDGVYNKVNVITLFNPDTKQYLIDQFSVQQLTNLRELLSPPSTVSTLKTASLFGSPDFKLGNQGAAPVQTNTTLRSIIGKGVPELPGTKEEVSKIDELLKANHWATHAYLFDEASESVLKTQQNVAILHVATHGFFIPTGEDGNQVVLTQNMEQAANSPLLRSGLILSGIEKFASEPASKIKQEDGILTAYEAINLNLDKTELVVLSACETGAGEIRNGEGVYGLQRAFLLAGASNLLMSLWKVDDSATQELMVEFYSQWNKTNNKATAFHNTQLELKKKYDAPYFWGSFVMIGSN